MSTRLAERHSDLYGLTVRSLPEWLGASHDAPIPPRVRLRIWEKNAGQCQSCRRKLASGDRWAIDHIQALILGGEHRESNLQVLCDWCHKPKTRREVAVKAKAASSRAKHFGIRQPKRGFRGWRNFKGEIVRPDD